MKRRTPTVFAPQARPSKRGGSGRGELAAHSRGSERPQKPAPTIAGEHQTGGYRIARRGFFGCLARREREVKYDPNLHDRRTIRLKDFDYSQPGAYFITICVKVRECILGNIEDDEVILTRSGLLVQKCWQDLTRHYPHLRLDAFVVMPNHVHGIMVLVEDTYAGAGTSPAYIRHGIPEIVRAFKAFSMMRVNAARRTRGIPLWQRNYYEHIIRNEDELAAIRTYIFTNPQRWSSDVDNPMFREE